METRYIRRILNQKENMAKKSKPNMKTIMNPRKNLKQKENS